MICRLWIILPTCLYCVAVSAADQAAAPDARHAEVAGLDLDAVLAQARRIYQEALDIPQRDQRLARFHQARFWCRHHQAPLHRVRQGSRLLGMGRSQAAA